VFNFIIQVKKIGGPLPPKKKLKAKNVQNSARFQTTSDFDREYLRNGWKYSKSDRRDRQRFYPRSAKKSPANFGKLTTKLDMWVWTHQNLLFWKTIFRPL